MWSGVEMNERAKHGLGFVIHPEKMKAIKEMCTNNRKKKNTTQIQLYAPCNDSYNEEGRLKLFEQLSDILNKVEEKDELVVVGYFNDELGKMRMEIDQLLFRANKTLRCGFRTQGRPRVRWITNVTEILRRRELIAISVTHLAQERKLHPLVASRHKWIRQDLTQCY
jgi:hypothetical protein